MFKIEGFKLHVTHALRPFVNRARYTPEVASRPDRLLKDLANAKRGQTVYVSSAAGAVGSVVVQLAKRDGLKVIASSGSDDKAQFVRECGADISFNYKSQDTEAILQEHGPIDMCVHLVYV